MAQNPILYTPDEESRMNSHMQAFLDQIQKRYDPSVTDYPALHQWSVRHRSDFWRECLEFTDIRYHQEATRTLVSAETMWQDRWFPGCRLNYAENLLRHRDDRNALIFHDESGERGRLSHAMLYAEVARIAAWLKAQGIRPGDRVAAFAANRIETVVAMLACTALGAVWSSCSPDFGLNGVLDRFRQIEPRVLFSVSSHCYAGKTHRHEQKLQALAAQLPSLKHIVLFPELYEKASQPEVSTRLQQWDDIPATDTGIDFHSADFNDPLFILYSSGTTGAPKCIVHGHGGTLLQHRKEHMLHVNLDREDVLFYFTTCGWMMWNWLVSGLASGATLVLYDGSPFHPHESRVFDLIDETGITVCGVSAKFISATEKAALRPVQTHRLDSLRTLLSTGSPLPPEGFDHVYRDFGHNLALQSISGGTDIISCFVLGCPLLPVRRGEIQCAGLGMDVAVFDETGNAVSGHKGELVCRESFPSMPVGFWNDPDNRKYIKAYFSGFPGVWTHGDYAEQTASGGFLIHGRSDTVLNPGGVRIGTAEIYRQAEQLPEVLECIAVGQDWQDDVRVLLFVRLAKKEQLDAELETRIRQVIRDGASPRHVPARILAVNDIPRTLSGKIAEVAVRNIINGEEVGNRDALANPEVLDEYRSLVSGLSQ